jgi:hypothetical protein
MQTKFQFVSQLLFIISANLHPHCIHTHVAYLHLEDINFVTFGSWDDGKLNSKKLNLFHYRSNDEKNNK